MLFIFPKQKHEDPRLFPFKRRVPSVDDLCSGRVGDVLKVLENCKRKRAENYHSKGYTRKKVMRHILDIPMEVLFHPEMGKYFAKGMDPHERKKNRWKFLQKFPQFKTVEKL